MSYLRTIPEQDANGAAAAMYETDREMFGSPPPNFTAGFSLRPDVYAAWRQLNAAIKSNMDLRRYELATLAAAKRLRSSYCALAHGKVLADQYLDAGTVEALMVDHHSAGLDEVDVAIMDLAEKVAVDATGVTGADVERLRDLGLSDEEIMDVVLAASVRCFFSKTLDGLGIEPDAKFAKLDPPLRDALTVGRPLSQTA